MLKRIIVVVIFSVILIGCGKKTGTDLSAEEIISKIKESEYPVDNIIVYTEETDWNELLGKPNQYTSKVNFADIRLLQYDENDPKGGTIEVFNNSEDAKTRYEYIASIHDDITIWQQYMYLHDNVLLRMDYDLKPDQAQKYDKALVDILDGNEPSEYEASNDEQSENDKLSYIIPGLDGSRVDDLVLYLDNIGVPESAPVNTINSVSYSGITNDYSYSITSNNFNELSYSIFCVFSQEDTYKYLGYCASLYYDSYNPDVAQEWVNDNARTNATTTIGDAVFTLSKSDSGIVLEIKDVDYDKYVSETE